jgi:cyclase
MLRTRVIPCLLLENESLVKTCQFKNPQYIGDPANTCRIFNELEVDELTFLDISASRENRQPNFKILSEIANECFMPVSYGGGISSVSTAEKVLKLGFEKIVLNTSALKNPSLISEISKEFGSQSIVISIDIKKSFLGYNYCRGLSGRFNSKIPVEDWAKKVQSLGAGEILLTSIDKEGTWSGFDLGLIQEVSSTVSIPVVANGGCGNLADIGRAVKEGNASAVALGSYVLFQKKGMGVLINFPDENELKQVLT